MFIVKKFSLILFIVALSGCASITTGNNQSMSFDSNVKGAQCVAENSKGNWHVKTPSNAVVNCASDDLLISCTKGDLTGSTKAKSTVKPMAMGNVLAGGLIGVGVDMATGAAYKYPQSVFVELK